MENDSKKIEGRLQNMKNFFMKVDGLIDSLPDTIPNEVKLKIKKAILGDNELKKLMEGIDAHRPPRIFLVGRIGFGKSSLINALCGAYVAEVSDTESHTKGARSYECRDNGRVLMEILDSRG